LRIYSKKARVNEYNYEHLVRLKHPAIQVMAKNIVSGMYWCSSHANPEHLAASRPS
ncbi:Uncharacterized protein HZ326_31545, partial [Fusarium oxysporum f. sp. albedinis]